MIESFTYSFSIKYSGPEISNSLPNSPTVLRQPDIVTKRILSEVAAGRISGPYENPPLPDFHVSPPALVPKKTPGEYHLIHNLSAPYDDNFINDHIIEKGSTVQYVSVFDAIKIIRSFPSPPFLSKTDIENGFLLICVCVTNYNKQGMSW